MIDIPGLIARFLADTAHDPEHQFKHRVISRIAADSRAHDAVNKMTKNIDEAWELIEHCVFAETQMRTFNDLLAGERVVVEQLQRHRESVEDLKQFIDQSTKYHDNPIVDWTPLASDPEHLKRLVAEMRSPHVLDHVAYQKGADYYRDALDCIAALIDERQRASDDAMLSFGVTRKSHTRTAAENAAIGSLAELVSATVGKPCASQVAVLAEVACGIDDVSEDRVREVLKALKARQRQSVHSTAQ